MINLIIVVGIPLAHVVAIHDVDVGVLTGADGEMMRLAVVVGEIGQHDRSAKSLRRTIWRRGGLRQRGRSSFVAPLFHYLAIDGPHTETKLKFVRPLADLLAIRSIPLFLAHIH
jgi:hypothetical protein